jgi:hypothetical protein
MKKPLLFIILIFGVIISCNNLSPKEKELRKILNKPLNLETFHTIQQANTLLSLDELKQNHGYLSVVYLQNSCNPCYPKFIEWQQKMDSIDTPDNYTVLFVIKGDSYGEFFNTE